MTKGTHWADEVQQAVNQCGIDDFVFKVLEYVAPVAASLNEAERSWKKRSQQFLLNNESDRRPQSPKTPINGEGMEYRNGRVYSYIDSNGNRVVNG